MIASSISAQMSEKHSNRYLCCLGGIFKHAIFLIFAQCCVIGKGRHTLDIDPRKSRVSVRPYTVVLWSIPAYSNENRSVQ